MLIHAYAVRTSHTYHKSLTETKEIMRSAFEHFQFKHYILHINKVENYIHIILAEGTIKISIEHRCLAFAHSRIS